MAWILRFALLGFVTGLAAHIAAWCGISWLGGAEGILLLVPYAMAVLLAVALGYAGRGLLPDAPTPANPELQRLILRSMAARWKLMLWKRPSTMLALLSIPLFFYALFGAPIYLAIANLSVPTQPRTRNTPIVRPAQPSIAQSFYDRAHSGAWMAIFWLEAAIAADMNRRFRRQQVMQRLEQAPPAKPSDLF